MVTTTSPQPDATLTGGRRRGPDRLFRGLAVSASGIVVTLVVIVGAFLVTKAAPSLAADTASFLGSREWDVADPTNLRFGIAQLLWVTVISSILAMALAVPVAIGVALYLTHYAPARVAKPFAYLVDLLAAVPSIVFGLWGARVLMQYVQPLQDFLKRVFGWFPLFAPTSVQAGTIFLASIVLAIMILPIITALSREVFRQTPNEHKEAALALGATRWEMIRIAVLPFGRPGVISASMLGLGRALGETIAVTIILSTTSGAFSWSLFFGGETFASKIANAASEFDAPSKTGAYIAAGLVLFLLTFAVNAVARIIIERRKAFSE
ncbi:phosphate ABC transporter permease subunit PstC [Cellulomonas sp.]|uniref:phosphate ABC transporter permease subunit PstC n=1 Tax=Cellulomonas sp. TaxID=40001 RepID=UPI0039C8620C